MTNPVSMIHASKPNVFVHNDKPVTTSYAVAEYFHKLHKDVLKKVSTLECSIEFNQRNFALVDYTDTKGEKRPMYQMTKDGFTFLAMGFTGKKAARFKEAYIAEFNRMEEQLKGQYIPRATPPVRTTVADRAPLREAVEALARAHKVLSSEMYAMLHSFYQVTRIADLTQEQLADALARVRGELDTLVTDYVYPIYTQEFEYPRNHVSLPEKPPVPYPLPVTAKETAEQADARNLSVLRKHFMVCANAWRSQIAPALRAVNSPLAGELHDRFTDAAIYLGLLEDSLTLKLLPGQTARQR